MNNNYSLKVYVSSTVYWLTDKRLFYLILIITLASLVAQTVKNPPAMRETWIRSLGWEDPLEEGMATHSSILAWRIPMDRGTWGAIVHGVTKSRTRLNNLTN